jgi:hypothetical protein
MRPQPQEACSCNPRHGRGQSFHWSRHHMTDMRCTVNTAAAPTPCPDPLPHLQRRRGYIVEIVRHWLLEALNGG